MPGALQPFAKLLEVVDLSVEDDDDVAVLVEDRLVARGEIYDPEALYPKTDATVNMYSARVRSPVLDVPAHALEQRFVDRSGVGSQLTGYATHVLDRGYIARQSGLGVRVVTRHTERRPFRLLTARATSE